MRCKKFLLVPFGAVAIALAVAATAYACTAFVGYFEVTGNCDGVANTPTYCGGNASETVHVEGQDDLDTFNMNQDVNTNVARVPASGGTVTIKTGIAQNGSAIPDEYQGSNYNPYNVLYYNNTNTDLSGNVRPGYTGSASDDSRAWNVDCMDEDTGGLFSGNGTKIGEATIGTMGSADEGEIVGVPTGQGTYNGDNTATYDLDDSLNTNTDGTSESALCIADDAYYYGNQAPFTVL